jgi:predicted RNase H-like HicB family nuclease
MQKEKIIIEIGYAGKNFTAHVPSLPGCVATGNTPEEIKQNILEAIQFHIEGSEEDNDPIPDSLKHDPEFAFRFNTESLINYFKPILGATVLGRITGINPKQIHHYGSGSKKPRIEKRKKIETALHSLGHELLAVEL